MGPASFRKIYNDLTHQRTQNALLWFTLTVGVTVITLAILTVRSSNAPFDRIFNQLKGAHLWLYIDTEYHDETLDLIQKLPEVEGVVPPYPIYWKVEIQVEGDWIQLPIMVRPGEQSEISQLLITKGEYLDEGNPMGIVLSEALASEHNLKVGDEVLAREFDSQSENSLTVIGLAIDVERNPQSSVHYAYVLSGVVDVLGLHDSMPGLTYRPIGVRLSNADDYQATLGKIMGELPEETVGSSSHYTWHSVQEGYSLLTQLSMIFILGFGLFASIAAGFILSSAISGRIISTRREIGILKAVGFSPRQVTNLFIVEYLLIGLAACALGIPMGTLGALIPLRKISQVLHTSTGLVIEPVIITAIVLGIEVLVLLSVVIPARRAGRLHPIAAIRGETSSGKSRLLGFSSGLMNFGIPLSFVMGVREVFTRPGRVLLTLLSIIIGAMTLGFSLSTQEAIEILVKNPSQAGFHYDIYAQPLEADRELIKEKINNLPQIHGYYINGPMVPGTFKPTGFDEDFSLQLWQIEDPVGAFASKLGDGSWMEATDEIVMGSTVMDFLGISIGDTIEVQVSGMDTGDHQTRHLTIVGTYRGTKNQGWVAIINRESMAQILTGLGIEPMSGSYHLAIESGADVNEVKSSLEEFAGGYFKFGINPDIPIELASIPDALLGISIIVGFIGLVGIYNTLGMTIQERQRAYGVMKAVGFSPGQIISIVLSGALLLVGLGVLIGLPAGILSANLLLRSIASWLNFKGLVVIVVQIGQLIVIGTLAIFLGLLSGFIPAQRALRTSVIETMRYST
jgi:putative ABC transport system permease protein